MVALKKLLLVLTPLLKTFLLLAVPFLSMAVDLTTKTLDLTHLQMAFALTPSIMLVLTLLVQPWRRCC